MSTKKLDFFSVVQLTLYSLYPVPCPMWNSFF